MPAIPLGIGAYKRSDAFVPEVQLRNLYLEEDKSGISPDKTMRVQRPGLSALYNYPSVTRLAHYRTATNERLIVSGTTLYSGTASKGTINGSDMAAATSTPFATVIASSGNAYLYDTAVAALALPNDAPSSGYVQDVDQLDAYALLLLPNGRFYWLEPGATTIDALNFATAESLPDKGVALRRLGDEFWIFGAENVEVWQSTGDADAPFQRASGRNFERGCLYRDSVRRFDNTLVWVGDDCQVYRAANVPQVISDSGLSERIRKATSECSAWTFGVDGHSFYVLRIPGQGTFVYDALTRQWAQWSSEDRDDWLPWVGYQGAGAIVVGSSDSGALWSVDPDAASDAGAAIQRYVSGTVPIIGKAPRNDSLSVGIGCSEDCTIRIRWKDGQDDYPDYYDEIDVRAPFDIATIWRLGMPDQPYRTFEISCVDSARVRIAGAVANEGWA